MSLERLSFISYERRIGGIGPAVWTADDLLRDMSIIRSLYVNRSGRFRAQFGPVRLSDEDPAEASEPAA